MEQKNVWTSYSENDKEELFRLTDQYKMCLDAGKTERECTALIVQMAQEKGYRNLEDLVREGIQPVAGDKVYAACMDKSVILFQIGKKPLEEGMNILGAHIDASRMDVKQNPLYEADEMAYLDTHYYGGIKKYQWTALPLAIHGVVVKKDGTKITISLGEKVTDPVFCVTDLMANLSAMQMEKPASHVIEGEGLDLLFGSRPIAELTDGNEEKETVIQNVKKLLMENYNIEETDFYSAELEIVPAGHARDCGLDRSMIMAYGQDDRVCAFASLLAMLDIEHPERTICCMLMDKEEIGSMGATGMESAFFENAIAELIALTGKESALKVRRALRRSQMLSCDVNAGYDPLFPEYFEKRSASFLGRGMVLCKFLGDGGKFGSNDANAEYIADMRRLFDEQNVAYQFAELGKIDVGGGGTISYMLANYGMEVVDSGVPILSMHAPWEIISKADFYEAYKGYRAFLRR